MGLIFRDPLQQCFQKQVSKVSFRIVPTLSQLLQNPKLKNYQSLLTSPAIPLLPSFIPYSTLASELSPSPRQTPLSTIRIGQIMVITYSPALWTMMQYQYSITPFPQEAAVNPPPILSVLFKDVTPRDV